MLIAELLMGLISGLVVGVALLAALIEALIALMFLVLEALGFIVGSVARSKRKEKPSPIIGFVRRTWFRRLGIASLLLLALMVIAAACLNFLFFEQSVRWLLARAESRTGIHAEFGHAEGNLFAGRVELTDVSLRRDRHPHVLCDMTADRMRFDVGVWSMLFGPRTIEAASLAGVRGEVRRVGKAERQEWFVRESLHIDQLDIEDANVKYMDETRSNPITLDARIDRLASERLRSAWIVFDLLFKTNAAGAVAGKPFSVARSVQGGSNLVQWRFDGLPAPVFGDVVGGPFGWLDQGEARVHAQTSWQSDARPDLNMQWSIELAGAHAELSEGLGNWTRLVSEAFVNYVNQRRESMSLQFAFDFDASGFEGSASADAAGLWRAVSNAAMQTLAQQLDLPPPRLEDWKEAASRQLQRLRRNPTSQPREPE